MMAAVGRGEGCQGEQGPQQGLVREQTQRDLGDSVSLAPTLGPGWNGEGRRMEPEAWEGLQLLGLVFTLALPQLTQ